MSYLVLARKWRPQTFADVTGQEHVVRTLMNALKTGRVAHAYLFTGPRGCGKTTTARILARAMNCEKGPAPEPCGACGPCREIAEGRDVDVHEMDAATHTGVDDVRGLRESAEYMPARDRYKVYIVDEVHMLSQNAFNAFLKTLEEPPGHVKFIFATTDPHKVPATVLSRCQRHNFKLVALQKIVARLRQIADAEKFECADEALVLVARAGQGSMRDALSALEQVVASRGTKFTAPEAAEALGMLERGAVAELARALLGADAKAALEVVERVYAGGHDLRQLVEDLCAHLRNLCVARLEGAPGLLDLPDHDAKAVREQAAAADPAQLTRLLDLALQAAESVAESSQPRYALEVALLKAIHLAPTTSIPALVERLDRLASAPGAPPAFASASASAPAPAPASANVPAASAQPTDWRAVVDLIKAKKPRLAAHLTFARPVAIGAEIKIAFASNDIHADEVQKERATLEQILGRKLSIEITGAGAGAGAAGPSLAEEKEKRERDEREAKARGGREDPRIRGAADLLGGAIEDVRVIGGGED